MNQLLEINSWKRQLGLLPVNLFSSTRKEKYILLNGGYGDFCIDLSLDNDIIDYYSFAWSSNTKNFVTLKNGKVKLYNWIKEKKEEYKAELIQNNLPKFYDYLLKDSYKSEYDIVPYIIDIYRKLRNLTNENKEGIRAINQLFLIFAAYHDKKDINEIDCVKWSISNIEKVSGIERYLEELICGITPNNVTLLPNLDLILRHTAGQLFQEAQKEAIFFNRNMNLFGFHDSKYDTKNINYSSFHYTPSFLARSIVEYSLSKLNLETENLKILDPACGSSEFLLEVLKQLKSLGYSGNIEIHGWDSSESAINISNFLLAYEKRNWNSKLNIKLKLVTNSLTEIWESDYDLILMNPPFLSWELMDKKNREIVTDALQENSRKKPNLASAFIFKGANHLKENGIIGTVIPSSILLMDSYIKLRNYIKDILTLLLVGKLGNFVFEHALTDVSILVGQKPKSETSPLVLWTKNEKGALNDVFRDLRKVSYGTIPYVKDKDTHSIYISDNYPIVDNWKVISYSEQKLIKDLNIKVSSGYLKTVDDLFDVKQGIRTGSKIFIISNEIYNELPKKEQKYFRKTISSIKNGKINESGYIWYPYRESGLIIKTEDQLRSKATEFYQKYLLPNKSVLMNLAQKNENNWWTLTRHREWLLTKTPKIISKEFGSSGGFAFDNKGELIFERGNGWIPKKEIQDDYYYFYLSIFNSLFFEELLSIFSKQLAGGKWYDLGKKYMKNIPLPDINQKIKDSSSYEKLVHLGKLIIKDDIIHLQAIDEIVKYNIYQIG